MALKATVVAPSMRPEHQASPGGLLRALAGRDGLVIRGEALPHAEDAGGGSHLRGGIERHRQPAIPRHSELLQNRPKRFAYF